ncbi:hypothetical protein TB2_021015 [Malus domestica]
MALKAPTPEATEIAIAFIGRGYDMSTDLRLKYCKGESHTARSIEIDHDGGREIVLPGGSDSKEEEDPEAEVEGSSNARKIWPKEFTALQSSKLIKGIFERFDQDRSGFIDANELRDALLNPPKEKSKSNDQATKREKSRKHGYPLMHSNPSSKLIKGINLAQ